MGQPSVQPAVQPTGQPGVQPAVQPTGQPAVQPAVQPGVRQQAQNGAGLVNQAHNGLVTFFSSTGAKVSLCVLLQLMIESPLVTDALGTSWS